KAVWAGAAESALSAAYAIASVADRVYVTQTGEVGSVGVVAVHIDESGADAMAGLKWTLIHAGARKVDGNPHEPLSARAFADIQADVDALHARLVEAIAANRGLPAEAVRATEAAIYRGARGVEVGFADRIGPPAQVIADLEASLDSPRRGTAPMRRVPSSFQPARSELMTTETAAGAAPAEPPRPTEPAPPAAAPAPQEAAPTTIQAAVLPSPAEKLRAQYAEIAAIAAQAARLGVTVDAAEAMRLGLMPDALRRSVLDALASRAEASAVVSAATTPTTTAESPIVRRARQRAAAGKPALTV
ncbi:MAG: S49 family peptidase, partial [Rhodospirillaceae bacterium]|nr:S49 family peptidase [Rhodospirillaceae bacterium]